MRASEATPLDHSRSGDPEYCCSGGKHRYHFRPGATKAVGALIWCCCKSVLDEVERETCGCPCCCPASGKPDDDGTPGWCDGCRMGIHQEPAPPPPERKAER